jgi:uncharacterized protein YwqG
MFGSKLEAYPCLGEILEFFVKFKEEFYGYVLQRSSNLQ